MQSWRQVLKLQMTFLCVFVRLRNVSIYRKLQKQIFQSHLHLTKYTSKNTPKTLNFLLDVCKVKYKGKTSPGNQRSQEAINVRMDMSHMRALRPHRRGRGDKHKIDNFLLVTTRPIAVLEITVGLRTLSDHFGHLSDPKMLGSDTWPSTIKGPLPRNLLKLRRS